MTRADLLSEKRKTDLCNNKNISHLAEEQLSVAVKEQSVEMLHVFCM
jgi:hypothetical protein